MKLLRDDMLMVPVPCAPGSRGPLMVGLAEMVKSGVGTGVTLMSRKVVWDNEPLLPVTTTGCVPTGVAPVVEIVSVEVPVPPELNGTALRLQDASRPATDPALAVKVTRPENPFRLVSVYVAVPDEP